MKIIVAVDKNWGIGNKGKLLFSIPGDMRFFKETTQNNVVVMGRKTFESLPGGKPLKDRVNIVLSGQGDGGVDRVLNNAGNTVNTPIPLTVCGSVDGVLQEIKKYAGREIFIIGGETVYRQFLDYCGEALITKVFAEREADSFFPNIDKLANWQKVWESEVKTHEGLQYVFTKYKNNKNVVK